MINIEILCSFYPGAIECLGPHQLKRDANYFKNYSIGTLAIDTLTSFVASAVRGTHPESLPLLLARHSVNY